MLEIYLVIMRITICFGGSILSNEEININVIRDIVKVLSILNNEKHEVFVVTGGGKVSRSYIKAAKEIGVSDMHLDEIGIAATRLNARLLAAALGELSYPSPSSSFEDAVQIVLRDKIPIMGGTVPGHTTDAVSAELADSTDSDFLIFFTNVDGVYTADPNINENAEKIESMSSSELVELVKREKFKPGMTTIIDPLAAEIIQKSEFETLVLGRAEIKRLPDILKGSSHSGTRIKSE